MYLFLKGLYYFFNSFSIILIFINNSKIYNNYKEIIYYNIICLIFEYLVEYIIYLIKLSYLNYIIFFFWSLPHYIISQYYNIEYYNKIIIEYSKLKHPDKKKFVCYEKLSNYIAHTIYYNIILIILILITSIIKYIPFIGIIIYLYLNSLLISYSIWINAWYFYNIPYYKRLIILENNQLFFFGYSILLGLIKLYFGFFKSNYILNILTPICNCYSININNKIIIPIKKKYIYI